MKTAKRTCLHPAPYSTKIMVPLCRRKKTHAPLGKLPVSWQPLPRQLRAQCRTSRSDVRMRRERSDSKIGAFIQWFLRQFYFLFIPEFNHHFFFAYFEFRNSFTDGFIKKIIQINSIDFRARCISLNFKHFIPFPFIPFHSFDHSCQSCFFSALYARFSHLPTAKSKRNDLADNAPICHLGGSVRSKS